MGGAGSMLIVTLLSSVLLYAPGAFFFYPWKPLMQWAVGDTYAVGYKFFRRDHNDPTNICLHFVALGWQLLGNFGFLAAIDALLLQQFPSAAQVTVRPFSQGTAFAWSLTLLMSPAPVICSVLSVLAISCAYTAAPFLCPRTLEMAAISTFMTTLVLASVLLKRKGNRTTGFFNDIVHGLTRFGFALLVRLSVTPWYGVWAAEANHVNGVLALVMIMMGLLPKPVVPSVLAGAIFVRIAGELTAQDPLLYYGAAFVAQASQGVAHNVTRQQATLLSHEASNESREEKMAFEWSHVVYFPNLLLHSAYDSCTASGSATETVHNHWQTKLNK